MPVMQEATPAGTPAPPSMPLGTAEVGNPILDIWGAAWKLGWVYIPPEMVEIEIEKRQQNIIILAYEASRALKISLLASLWLTKCAL